MGELKIIAKTFPQITDNCWTAASIQINKTKIFNDLAVPFLFDHQKNQALSNNFQEFVRKYYKLVGMPPVMVREIQEVNTYLQEFYSLIPELVRCFQENDQPIPIIVPLVQESDSLSSAIARRVQVSISCLPMIVIRLTETVSLVQEPINRLSEKDFKRII